MSVAPEAVWLTEMPPHVAPEQPAPVRVQSHPAAAASLVTVQEKVCVADVCTLAVPGETETTIGLEVTVMVALAVFWGLVIDAAVSVTVAGLGTEAGAV